MKDHKAEAELLAESERTAGGNRWFANDADRYAAAQAHATLYLAEQQRAANLLALAGFKYQTAGGSLATELKAAISLRNEAAMLLGPTEAFGATND